LPELSKTSDPASTFLASLPTIDRVTAILGRRNGLSETDIEDFTSWARARLIQNDYAVLRKFGGRSSLDTYLSVVLANLFKDFRNSRWGRWRPSAMARRLGPLAVRFETLVYRDGQPFREAMEVLKSGGNAEAELRSIAGQLPSRVRIREVAFDTAVEAVPARDHSGGDDDSQTTDQAVQSALAELPAEDQVIVRMRFWDDFSVADIARALHLDQKPLYRRLEAIQSQLGALLATRGIDRARVAAILAREERV
jgi:RNA polymerase sigma factor for flagellar operon FliA